MSLFDYVFVVYVVVLCVALCVTFPVVAWLILDAGTRRRGNKRVEMEMRRVKSGHIVSVGHDPATGYMHVEFKSGKVYRYPDVSVEKYAALLDADSIGSCLYHEFPTGKLLED